MRLRSLELNQQQIDLGDIETLINEIHAATTDTMTTTIDTPNCDGALQTQTISGPRLEAIAAMIKASHDDWAEKVAFICRILEVENAVNDLSADISDIKRELTEEETVTILETPCPIDGVEQPPIEHEITSGRLKLIKELLEKDAELADKRALRSCESEILEKIFKLIDGPSWKWNEQTGLPERTLKVEEEIEDLRKLVYPLDEDEEEVTLNSIPQLLQAWTAVRRFRQGEWQLPIEHPPTLFTYTDGEEKLITQDKTAFFFWFVQQFDALLGQFPIKLDIVDSDPLTEGNQPVEVELPNLSEAIAELYGLLQMVASNSDVNINFLSRIAVELLATKNSSLVTQDHTRAISTWLGYKGNPAKRTIPSAINPDLDEVESLSDLLTESEYELIGWKNDDPETLVAFLQRLLFSAGIIKNVFFKSNDQMQQLQDQIQRMSEDAGVENDEEWTEFISRMNNSASRFNADNQTPQPFVRDRTQDDEG